MIKSVKVGHIADLQVKNRENNLYNSYACGLNYVIDKVKEQQLDVLVIAGDLFEYCEPNHSEQKLIYEFLSCLTSIPYLREIVVMAGNHDLPKFKKSQITNDAITEDVNNKSNAVNVFMSIINIIQSENKDKFIYINESKVYDSKHFDNIQYIGYCLEDGAIPDLSQVDENKVKICVFHAMIQEYVEDYKLPLRKDIKESLKDLSIFPDNSYVLAGDIHLPLEYEDKGRNVKFIYPGSTQQHTHNEGDYHYTENGIYKVGPRKRIMLYDIDEENNVTRQYSESIIDFVRYITIETSNKLTPEENFKAITECRRYNFGYDSTYIKIKATNSLSKFERQIYEFFTKSHQEYDKFVKPTGKCIVTFDYEKIVSQVTEVDNEVVKEIIREVTENNSNTESEEKPFVFEPGNIDNLILNDAQLSKMFDYVAQEQLNKSTMELSICPDIKENLLNLFKEQLALVIGKTKRYNICLKSVQCSQFMALGKNRIDLDTEGITRILGTNGIGKTTLFNMIRWVLTGMVYSNMKSNKAVQNNLVIFNKDNIDDDSVKVLLNITNNDVPIKIYRVANRKWKNGTTNEQKLSKNWKQYATVTTEVIVKIHAGEENEKTINGENAQNNINAWFGEVIKNIMFINSMSIDEMLKSNTVSINDMIMSFIGVDYLKHLEDNLETVKDSLYSVVAKPKVDRQTILNMISDNEKSLEEGKSTLEHIEKSIDEVTDEINNEESNKETYSDKLMSLGNVPEQIENKRKEIDELNIKISQFVEKQPKELLTWNKERPTIDTEKKNDLTREIEQKDNQIKEIEDIISDCNCDIEKYKNEIVKLIGQKIESCSANKAEYNNIINESNTSYMMRLNEISKVIDDTLDKIRGRIEVVNATQNNYITDNLSIQKRMNEIDEAISSGVCDKCHRPFDEHYEDIKRELLIERERITETKNNNSETISELSEKIKSYNSKLKEYSELKTSLYSGMDTMELAKLLGSKKIADKYSEFIADIIELSHKINDAKKFIDKFESIETFLHKCISTKNVSDLFELLKGTPYVDIFNLCNDAITYQKSKEKAQEDIVVIKNQRDELKNESDKIDNDFIEALAKYQESYDLFVKENENIASYNKSIEDENKINLENKFELNKCNVALIDLEHKRVSWDEVNKLLENTNNTLKTYRDNLKQLNDKKVEYNVDINTIKHKIEDLKKSYDDCLIYFRNDIVYKIYSRIIKSSFKDIVFEYYRTFLNSSLDVLLQDVKFKLFWDSSLTLMMITFKNGNTSYIPVTQASGMETIFTGLSLIYTISILNIKHTCSHIFIDELSGQLSTGKHLHGEVKNYQELFVKIINKFKDRSIFIIDHNIDDMNESMIYEVIEGENGNLYKQI